MSDSRKKVERAKIVRKQLRELYEERNRLKVGTGREGSKEEFTRLKEKYFRLVNVDNNEILYPTLTINRQWCKLASWKRKWGSRSRRCWRPTRV